MKTVTRLAIASLMMVLVLAGWSQAQTPVKVTFRVNTSTVKDTLRSSDVVQIRGAIDGKGPSYNGQVIDWNASSTLIMKNEGNDTWSFDVMMTPGDKFNYKYWVGYRNKDGQIVNTETVPNTGWESSDNRAYTLPANATAAVVLPTVFYDDINPFTAIHADTVQVRFKVNVGRAVQDGLLNLSNANHKVQVRGGTKPLDWGSSTVNLTKEANPSNNVGMQFYSGVAKFAKKDLPTNGVVEWKYAIDRGDGVTWEDGNNKQLNLKDASGTSTEAWSFFNNLRPTNAKRVNTSFIFAIQVGALEELGYFDASKGDSVYVASDFSGWADDSPAGDPRPKKGPAAGKMTFESSIGAWSKSIPSNNVAVGSTRKFKYYIQWARSRFVSNSLDVNYRPNSYIPGLTGDTGYEEPGEFGGGDRVYTVVDNKDQFTFDPAQGISFYNGIPREGFFDRANVQGGASKIKFRINMNPAKTADVPFVPASDSVFIVFETNFFALTQGLRPGEQSVNGITDLNNPSRNFKPTKADLEKILMVDPDKDGVYELEMPLRLPTLNDIGFRIAYGQPLSAKGTIMNGGGFDAGRRYYQFIRPSVVSGKLLWPSSYTFPLLTWSKDKLPYEKLPNYKAILSSDEGDQTDLPSGFALAQNYPNPFNPSTMISFTLPVASDVRLTVYNSLGQKVATVLNQQRFTAGMHNISFDAGNLASGVYIYRLEANNFKADRKMVLIK